MNNRCLYILAGILSLAVSACDRPGQSKSAQNPTEAEPAEKPTYHALVIGIGDYTGTGWPQLGTARADAEEIGCVLRTRYGFNVTELTDRQATRETILRTLDQLMRLTSNDALLIYFAGHGFYDGQMDEGYWIPFGARRERMGQPAKEDWLWNSSIDRILGASPARHILLIADTCYGGSLFRGEDEPVKSAHWYKRAIKVPSRYLITSGNLEPVLDSGIRHSIFAREILKFLQYTEQDVFSASDIAISIRSKVCQFTGQLVRMGPLASTAHAGGEFVFIRPEVELPTSETTEPVPEEPTFRNSGLKYLANRIEASAFVRPRVLACLGPIGNNPATTAMVQNRLHEALEATGGSILVERKAFDSLLHEVELGRSELADHRVATEIGKLLPASLILFGEIIPFEEQEEVHLRIVDTETSRVLSSVSASFRHHNELDSTCRILAEQIMKTMIRARPLLLPAQRTGTTAIKAGWGRFHGARTGDSFKIVTREDIDTIAPRETILGSAELTSLGEEYSTFQVQWENHEPEPDAAIWLKEVF